MKKTVALLMLCITGLVSANNVYHSNGIDRKDEKSHTDNPQILIGNDDTLDDNVNCYAFVNGELVAVRCPKNIIILNPQQP